MSDAISRSELLKILREWPEHLSILLNPTCEEYAERYGFLEALVAIAGEVERLPALDVAPVVHARWIMVDREAFWIGDEDIWMGTGKPTIRQMPVCSHCKKEFGTAVVKYKRCPECGARMDGEAE